MAPWKAQITVRWSSTVAEVIFASMPVVADTLQLKLISDSTGGKWSMSGTQVYEGLVYPGREAYVKAGWLERRQINPGDEKGYFSVEASWGPQISVALREIPNWFWSKKISLGIVPEGPPAPEVPPITPPTPPPPEGPPPPPITGPTLPPTPENWWDIAAWLKWLGLVIAAVFTWVMTTLWTILSDLFDKLVKSFWNLLPDWLKDLLTKISDWLKDAKDWITAGVRFMVEATGGKIVTSSPEKWESELKPRPKYDSSVSWPWGGLVEAMRAAIGDFEESANRTVTASESAQSTYPTAVPGSLKVELRPVQKSPEAQVPEWKTKSDKLQAEYAAKVLETATKPMDELMAKASPVDMNTAMTIAGSVTTAATMITLAGVISGVAAEAASIGQIEEVGKGVREFIRLTGVSRLAKDFVTAPISMGVKPWVSRYYDQLFRTHIFSRDEIDEFYIKDPTLESLWKQHYAWYGYPDSYIEIFERELRKYPAERLADQMLFEGHITPQRWSEIYDKLGWRPELKEAWQKTMWREPREFLLSRLLDVAPEESEQIEKWLREGGYDEAGASKLLGMFFKLAYKDEVQKLISQSVTDLVDGWIPSETFLSNLEKLGRPEDEISFKLAAAELQEARDIRKKKLENLRDKANRGEITIEQFKTSSAELGLQADRIEVEVDSIHVEEPEVKVRELTVAEVRRLFKENLAAEEITRTRLLDRNVSPDDTDLMIQDDYYSIFKDERTKLINSALDDLDFGSISVDVCKGRLLACRLREEEADLRIADTLEDHARKVRKELFEIYTKDYREDVMTEAQYREALKSIPLTEDRIDETVMIENERKKPEEVRGG